MIVICLLMFPEMKGEMDSVSDIFASMGSFTAAFGMDRLNFGELMGFYGVECGNILGIGGAFFAALAGISALAGEEKNRTAEFLLTHPVLRGRVVVEKLLSVCTQIISMNVIIVVLALLSARLIGEKIAGRPFFLLHLAYLLMQIETAMLCFCISAFLNKGGAGLGIGLAAVFYFMDIVANISEKAAFLKYVTPFGYADPADIIEKTAVDGGKMAVGLILTAISIAVALIWYSRKDIKA